MEKVIKSALSVLHKAFLISAGTLFLSLAFELEILSQLNELRLDQGVLLLLGGLALAMALVISFGNEMAYRTASEERLNFDAPLIKAEYEERFRLLLEKEFNLSPEEVEAEMRKFRDKL